MKLNSLLFLLCSLVATHLVLADEIVATEISQNLSSSDSNVRATLNAGQIQLTGQLLSYQGTLKVEQKSQKLKYLNVKADLSSIKVDPSQGFELLASEVLFKSMKDPVVVFESEKIIPLSQKRHYKIEGVLKRGNKKWLAVVEVIYNFVSKNRSDLYLNLTSPLLQVSKDLVLPVNANEATATLESKLVFLGRK